MFGSPAPDRRERGPGGEGRGSHIWPRRQILPTLRNVEQESVVVESGAKGVVVAPVVKMLKTWLKENPGAHVEGLREEDTRFFGYARVLATEYYDLDTYHRFVQAAHRHVFGGSEDGARMMGAGAAQTTLGGVYQVFLIQGDPARTLSAAPRMWSAHYRGSEAKVDLTASGARVSILGYGPMPPVMQKINVAWLEECVRMAGASGIRSIPRQSGRDFFVDMTWSRPR